MNIKPPQEKLPRPPTYIWDYSKLNAPLLTRLLQNTNWDHILNHEIDAATDLFTSALLNAASASIPVKRKMNHAKQKPWVTSELCKT